MPDTGDQLSPQGTSEPEFSYFQVQSFWGATKHIGGQKATEELVELCHIGKDKYVLEVGCGVGSTAVYLAKRHGCRVVGVDISERMIEWARKRAERAGVQDRVEFRVADAQDLPFDDGLFDAVICESVTAFPEDKQRAVDEYARVTKTGGYVGLNEGTWIKTPPPTELVEYMRRSMANARFLPPEAWKQLLETSGVRDIVVRTYTLSALSQWSNQMRGTDLGEFSDRLRAWGTFLSLFIKSPAFRKYAREITPSRKTIRTMFEYFGYGLYVGSK